MSTPAKAVSAAVVSKLPPATPKAQAPAATPPSPGFLARVMQTRFVQGIINLWKWVDTHSRTQKLIASIVALTGTAALMIWIRQRFENYYVDRYYQLVCRKWMTDKRLTNDNIAIELMDEMRVTISRERWWLARKKEVLQRIDARLKHDDFFPLAMLHGIEDDCLTELNGSGLVVKLDSAESDLVSVLAKLKQRALKENPSITDIVYHQIASQLAHQNTEANQYAGIQLLQGTNVVDMATLSVGAAVLKRKKTHLKERLLPLVKDESNTLRKGPGGMGVTIADVREYLVSRITDRLAEVGHPVTVRLMQRCWTGDNIDKSGTFASFCATNYANSLQALDATRGSSFSDRSKSIANQVKRRITENAEAFFRYAKDLVKNAMQDPTIDFNDEADLARAINAVVAEAQRGGALSQKAKNVFQITQGKKTNKPEEVDEEEGPDHEDDAADKKREKDKPEVGNKADKAEKTFLWYMTLPRFKKFLLVLAEKSAYWEIRPIFRSVTQELLKTISEPSNKNVDIKAIFEKSFWEKFNQKYKNDNKEKSFFEYVAKKYISLFFNAIAKSVSNPQPLLLETVDDQTKNIYLCHENIVWPVSKEEFRVLVNHGYRQKGLTALDSMHGQILPQFEKQVGAITTPTQEDLRKPEMLPSTMSVKDVLKRFLISQNSSTVYRGSVTCITLPGGVVELDSAIDMWTAVGHRVLLLERFVSKTVGALRLNPDPRLRNEAILQFIRNTCKIGDKVPGQKAKVTVYFKTENGIFSVEYSLRDVQDAFEKAYLALPKAPAAQPDPVLVKYKSLRGKALLSPDDDEAAADEKTQDEDRRTEKSSTAVTASAQSAASAGSSRAETEGSKKKKKKSKKK